jgi:transposase-like protein
MSMMKIKAVSKKSKGIIRKRRAVMVDACEEVLGSTGKLELIQMLIPIGLEAVANELQAEVKDLVGLRYGRDEGPNRRWGENPGSVYLGGQKVPVNVPRVRDLIKGEEVPLKSYHKLQKPRLIEENTYKSIINGLSSRKYETVVGMLPATFGIAKTSVSRRFKVVSGKKLQELMERDLSKEDIIAIFIDGKSLAKSNIIIALGITMEGEKVPLGFIETTTENADVSKDFLNNLLGRGLSMDNEILFILDGSKGLRKAVRTVFGAKALIQRCQWHKRENVLKYLDKKLVPMFRRRLQAAYEQPTYEKAKRRLMAIKKELTLLNASAVESLEEGLEETLTLHRLGMFETLGRSFKTTNCIESLNKQIEMRVGRVCYWKNSNQRQRWIASALLEIEPGLNRVCGHSSLKTLRVAMKSHDQQILKEAA